MKAYEIANNRRSRCSTSYFSLSLSSPHSWIYNRQEGDRVTHEWKNQQSLYFCQRESCIYLLIAANRLFVDVTFSIGKKKTSKWAPFLLFFWLIFQDSFQHFFFFFFFSDFISVPLKRNGSSRHRIENKINRSTSYSLIKKKKKFVIKTYSINSILYERWWIISFLRTNILKALNEFGKRRDNFWNYCIRLNRIHVVML